MLYPAPPDRLNSFSEISLSHLGHLFCCCDLLSELLNVLVAQLGSFFNTSHFWTLIVFIEFVNSSSLNGVDFQQLLYICGVHQKPHCFALFFFHAVGSQCKHGGTGCYQSHQTGTGWVITSFLLSFFSLVLSTRLPLHPNTLLFLFLSS